MTDISENKYSDQKLRVNCPKCLGHFIVHSNKIPKGGAWGKCPACGERFRIGGISAADLLEDPPETPSKPLVKQKSRSPVFRYKSEEGVNFDEIIVFDYPSTNYRIWAIGLITGVFLITMFGGFFLRSFYHEALAEVSGVEVTSASVPLYGDSSFRDDLVYLKRKTSHRSIYSEHINYTGPESRSYKYALLNLAPEACKDIVSLDISSGNTSTGFMYTAQCLDEQQKLPVIVVNWNDRWANIKIRDHSEILSALLYPPVEQTIEAKVDMGVQ